MLWPVARFRFPPCPSPPRFTAPPSGGAPGWPLPGPLPRYRCPAAAPLSAPPLPPAGYQPPPAPFGSASVVSFQPPGRFRFRCSPSPLLSALPGWRYPSAGPPPFGAGGGHEPHRPPPRRGPGQNVRRAPLLLPLGGLYQRGPNPLPPVPLQPFSGLHPLVLYALPLETSSRPPPPPLPPVPAPAFPSGKPPLPLYRSDLAAGFHPGTDAGSTPRPFSS